MPIIEYRCNIYIVRSGKIIKKDYNITVRRLKNSKFKTSWNKKFNKGEQKHVIGGYKI